MGNKNKETHVLYHKVLTPGNVTLRSSEFNSANREIGDPGVKIELLFSGLLRQFYLHHYWKMVGCH